MNQNQTQRTHNLEHLMRFCADRDGAQSILELAPFRDAEDETVPLPLSVVLLLALLTGNENETEIAGVEAALRELYLPGLTAAQCRALVTFVGNSADLATALEKQVPVIVYPSGEIFSIAAGYPLQRLERGWTIHVTQFGNGHATTSLSKAHEIAAYIRGVPKSASDHGD